MKTRKLALKRDVLQELGTDELSDVVAGTVTGPTGQGQTHHSCLAYISCYPQDCVRTANCV